MKPLDMLLVIDVGNTRTKWAVFNKEGQIASKGVSPNADLLAAPAAWQGCQRAIVANVAGESMAQNLSTLLANLPVTWAKAGAQAGSLNNHYQAPEKLGIDRWAALVAAFDRYQNSPCLVVNAGTALTVDAIHQQAFIGGLIAPGLNMLMQGFNAQTASVNAAGGVYQAFPKNTADASYSGALNAMVGAVLLQFKQLQALSAELPALLLTGGDAALLQPVLNAQGLNPNLVEDLVLQGLYLIEGAKP